MTELATNSMNLFSDQRPRLFKMAEALTIEREQFVSADELLREIVDKAEYYASHPAPKRDEAEKKKKHVSSLEAGQWEMLSLFAIRLSGERARQVFRDKLLREIVEAALVERGF